MDIINEVVFITVVIIGVIFLKKSTKHYELPNNCQSFQIKSLNIGELLFCLLIAFAVSLQFSTCPFFYNDLDVDSSVFIYIGKGMHRGLVPYKDIFDHKGMFLYLIQYLGLLITPNSYIGIWIIELVNMLFFVVFTLKITKLFTQSHIIQYITILFIPAISGSSVYRGGNFVEEYSLPWITISLYIFLKFIFYSKYKFRDIIVIGISFSIVLFLRPNMIAVWVTFIPIVFLNLLFSKKIGELFLCIINFLMGCIIVFAPFIVYFILTNSLNDVINCYIIFNFNYAGNMTEDVNRLGVFYIFLTGMIIIIPSIVVTAPLLKNRKYRYCFYYLLVSFLMILISKTGYIHYAITILPAIVVPFVVMMNCIDIHKIINYRIRTFIIMACLFISIYHSLNIYILNKVVPTVCLILFVVALIFNVNKNKLRSIYQKLLNFKCGRLLICIFSIISLSLYSLYILYYCPPFDKKWYSSINSVSDYISENTKPEDDVLILGNFCEPYIKSNRYTNNKFPYQYPPIDLSDKYYKEFRNELIDSKPDVVIALNNKEGNLKMDSHMGDIYRFLDDMCNEKIYSYEQHDDFYVYKLNK